MNEDKEHQRPTCSCGTKMKYVEYIGYYDNFNFWECPNNDCNAEENFKPDQTDRGDYA